MTTTTEFQLVDINKLVPYANNARTHNKEQILKLRSSLREFGFVNPVIIDKDYNVLAGHGRIMAAKEESQKFPACMPTISQRLRRKRIFSLIIEWRWMLAGTMNSLPLKWKNSRTSALTLVLPDLMKKK